MTGRLRVAVAVVLAGLAATGCGGDDASEAGPVDRVLVVSLPGLDWEAVQDADLPNLDAFVDQAAVADLATRIGRRGAALTDAYLTIGAGTRAVAPDVDPAVAVGVDERYGNASAEEVMRRRVGGPATGISYLAIGAARDANDRSEFGADVGILGDELRGLGIRRAVVANADQLEEVDSETELADQYFRPAATALMDSRGTVPAGDVGRSLLVKDGDAAYGHRLDEASVLEAFDAVWSPDEDEDEEDERAVVLVEASDLARVELYRAVADTGQRARMRLRALERADRLLGSLLERVDEERTAVTVLSPIAPSGSPSLAMVALRAPGVSPGLLRSATTRRDGYVELSDVAPTVLGLLGEDPPEGVTGAAFEVAPVDADERSGRVAGLADAAEAADVRDRMVAPVALAFVAVLAVVALGALVRDRLPAGVRAALAPVALGILGAVPATFVAGSLGLLSDSVAAYAAMVVALAVLIAAAAWAVERRAAGTALIVALAALVLLVVLDVLVGAPLQVNTVFGYSVAVAGRFAGLGNLAYALLGSGAVVLSALLAERFGRRGVTAALLVLTVVAFVDGFPMLGADVGGLLSMVPAFGVTALVLLGRDVRVRDVVLLGLAGVACVLTFAFIDLARPDDARTHLARLARHVLDGRWGPFFDTLSRRWQASFGGAELAAWATIGLVVVGVAVYVALVVTRHAGPRASPVRLRGPAAAAGAGLAVLALLGLVANDSSFAVPGMMLIVVVPVLVFRSVRTPVVAAEAGP